MKQNRRFEGKENCFVSAVYVLYYFVEYSGSEFFQPLLFLVALFRSVLSTVSRYFQCSHSLRLFRVKTGKLCYFSYGPLPLLEDFNLPPAR